MSRSCCCCLLRVSQVVEPPVRQLSSQDPSIDDIAAAMSVVDPADSSLGEDEEPDVALTAFDHMVSGGA